MISTIRLRMSAHDAHYGGNLVDGARMLQLFGDVATELLIISDGDEGLFKAYDEVEFVAPVYAGDYIEATRRDRQDGQHFPQNDLCRKESDFPQTRPERFGLRRSGGAGHRVQSQRHLRRP